MEKNRSIEEIPTWSFGYIINGDKTGLLNEEIKIIDELFQEWKIELISSITENEEHCPYFSNYPLFGKPTEVEDCIVQFHE
ncbi:DUF6926 domain-containing protein [Butyricimonas paravirosa]